MKTVKESSTWRWMEAAEWDAIAAGSPGATYFHRRAWAEAVCRHDPRFEPRALGLVAARGEWALMPLCVRRGWLRRGLAGRAASTQPGTYGGPILAGRTLTREDWPALLEALDGAPLGRIDCFDNVLDPVGEGVLGPRAVVEYRETHVIDLGQLPPDPRTTYRKGCKHAITKARSAGMIVARLGEAASIGAYYEVYLDSLRRWGKPPEEAYGRSLFDDLLGRQGAELWVARTPEGRVAAGGVFLFTRRHCVWWHGAMSAELQGLGPSNLLIHELLQVARQRGCELFDFNPSGGHSGVESFKRSFCPEVRRLRVWRHDHPLLAHLHRGRAAHAIRPDPVIVLGNQKSGTSAIASLLADMGGLSKTIDVPALWERKGLALMRGDASLAEVISADPTPFASDVIKEPMMTFFANQVLEVFPGARYVFLARDPRDNIRSLLNRRGLPGNLERLGPEQIAALGRRMTVDPAAWGGADENYVGVLAHRWNLAADVGRTHAARMAVVRYEDFMADKLGFLRALALRLGIEERIDVTPLLAVQYQPRGDREIDWLGFFGKENLARIERISGECMAAFGYAPILEHGR